MYCKSSAGNEAANADVSMRTKSKTDREYENGGNIKDRPDLETNILTQKSCDTNTSLEVRLIFDAKISKLNNTNSAMMVMFDYTEYVTTKGIDSS